MENQEFDIELLEKKLEEYEQADSNVRSEEVLEFVKKVLDITLLQLSKGNVSDRDIEEDIRFVRDEIGKPDFLKQLVLHVQQAADRWASASKEENGQDYLFSELCLLIKLGRNAVCTLGFLCCREGKFGVLYDFMTAGNQVLGGYYDWKTRLRSYFMNLITPSMLAEAFDSLRLGKVAVQTAGWRTDNTMAVPQLVSDYFLYVDKAYGARLDVHLRGETLATPARLGFPAVKFDLFYDGSTGLFKLPFGFQGWFGLCGERTIVAFAGTRLLQLGTVFTDAEQIFGPSLIYACAVGMVALVAQHMGQGNLFVLGHSLGGGLTQFAVAANRSNHIEGWGFNSAGLSETSVRALLTAADVAGGMENVVLHHYVTGADPVSKLGGLVGTVTTIPGSADLGHTRDDLRQVI